MNIYKINSFFCGLAVALCALCSAEEAGAQNENTGVVRRGASERRGTRNADDGPQVTERMQAFFENNGSPESVTDADRQWMRVMYRELDLNKDKNAPLYFPEEPVDGNLNLFRIIMKLLADNRLTAYEYLDGREVFSDEYKVNVRDLLNRFYIMHSAAPGSTDKNPKFLIQESDVPSQEVLSYFIIERWEYDTRRNKLRPYIEAICPVLHRTGDFGGEAVKYPMFWVKFSDIRPWLAQQPIFLNDDNNLPTCTYDDFFNMTMYDGEIYKTRNLKNKSMAQLYPDPDDRKRAQDSIQARLDNFEAKLWTPSREEVIAAREAREALAEGKAPVDPLVEATEGAAAAEDVTAEKPAPRRSTARSSKAPAKKNTKKPKQSKPKVSNSSSSNAVKSVRRRK